MNEHSFKLPIEPSVLPPPPEDRPRFMAEWSTRVIIAKMMQERSARHQVPFGSRRALLLTSALAFRRVRVA